MVESNSNRFRDPSVFKTVQGPAPITLHIETHWITTILPGLTPAMSLNVLLYGRGTLNRTRTYGFKVRSTTTMLYPNKLQQIFKEQVCIIYQTRWSGNYTVVLKQQTKKP